MQPYFRLLLIQEITENDLSDLLDEFEGATTSGLNVACRDTATIGIKYVIWADGAVVTMPQRTSQQGIQYAASVTQISELCQRFLIQGKPVVLLLNKASGTETANAAEGLSRRYGIDVFTSHAGQDTNERPYTRRVAYERIIELLALVRRGFAHIDKNGISFRSNDHRHFDPRLFPMPAEQLYELVG